MTDPAATTPEAPLGQMGSQKEYRLSLVSLEIQIVRRCILWHHAAQVA